MIIMVSMDIRGFLVAFLRSTIALCCYVPFMFYTLLSSPLLHFPREDGRVEKGRGGECWEGMRREGRG
jgi:hypothetical protein